jgi:hydroxymethylbilane synthase
MKNIRIATRESKLALWQASFLRDQLRFVHPEIEVTLVGMSTEGDRWLDAPLSEIGGKGLFVKELEIAMLEGRADMAVHSVKDLPAVLPEGFSLPLIAFREDTRDVLVSSKGPLEELPRGAKIGSSSLRRKAQLLSIRPDLDLAPIRGNVGTRLDKLDSGEFDGIVLAAAGLSRLELYRQDLHPLSVNECIPAPGQGALGVEILSGSEVETYLSPLQDLQTSVCVRAERGVSAGLGADCALPVAASAHYTASNQIRLSALVADALGRRIVRSTVTGTNPSAIADEAVAELLASGAGEILDSIRQDKH